jgi:hypothetical protein
MRRFETQTFDAGRLREHAMAYSRHEFDRRMRAFIEERYCEFRGA